MLIGTSSDVGNMFSAAASAVLRLLPMLPGQILPNNLLYDGGQLAIPLTTSRTGGIASIRRFMLFFGRPVPCSTS